MPLGAAGFALGVLSGFGNFSVVSTRTFATPKPPELRECGENYKRDRFCNDRDGSNIIERGQSGFHTRLFVDDRPDLAAFINSCPRSVRAFFDHSGSYPHELK